MVAYVVETDGCPDVLYRTGRRHRMVECVSSTAESLRAAMHEAFPKFETPQDKQHGLSKEDHLDIGDLAALLVYQLLVVQSLAMG